MIVLWIITNISGIVPLSAICAPEDNFWCPLARPAEAGKCAVFWAAVSSGSGFASWIGNPAEGKISRGASRNYGIAGVTRDEVAAMLHVAAATLDDWESGRTAIRKESLAQLQAASYDARQTFLTVAKPWSGS